MSAQSQVIENVNEDNAARQMIVTTGIASTVLGALYCLGLVGKLIVDGSVHSISAPPVQTVSAVIAIGWDVVLVVLFVALRAQASPGKQIFADLALAFMLLVCAASSTNWFVQLAVVPRLDSTTEANLLALLDVHSPHSLMYAMEHLGWGLFYGLGAIFACLAVEPGRWAGWMRGLLLAGGVLSLVHAIGVVLGSALFGDLAYIAWGVLLPVTTALFAARYRKGC